MPDRHAQPAVLVPVSAREVISAFAPTASDRGFEAASESAADGSDSNWFGGANGHQAGDSAQVPIAVAVAESSASGAQYQPAQPVFEEPQDDQLDIPTFMRKGGL